MKWFLLFLAIGLVVSEKLDRTYLPPPGAKFSGGILGDGDVPLEPPNRSHSGANTPVREGSQTNFGLGGEHVNFGDKIPKVPFSYDPERVPTTTISYAFSQTTTYPPAENYETTVLPINPVTGLPVNLDQTNYAYSSPEGQQDAQNLPIYAQNQEHRAPSYGTKIQPNFYHTYAPASLSSPGRYEQSENQQLSQYQGQDIINPGGPVQIPGSIYHTTNQSRYPGEKGNEEQQGFFATSSPENYSGQNVVSPGGAVQIPGGNQNFIQYPGEQLIGQHLVPSTASPTNILSGDNPHGVNYDGFQGKIPQGTYLNQLMPQLNEATDQNQVPQNIELKSESTLSSIPSSYYNDVSSTTHLPGIPSSTSTYSSVRPFYSPERPQAAGDRNAVILNYDNVRTSNSYSYSFDTSNGIHADESGIIDNGTKAQGAYSYIGDDGKVYSVIYTADENGFQPRGDHLPTPPPIPEAIKRVIEQAARDKEAGIIDDGSYDEAKYGDKKYQGPVNRRRPQKFNSNRVVNKPVIAVKNYQIKPIPGINESKYDEGIQNQFTDEKGKSNGQHISQGNRNLSENDAPSKNLQHNGMPTVIKAINDIDNYGTKKPGTSDEFPKFIENNLPYSSVIDDSQNNQFGAKNLRPSGNYPVSGGIEDMKTKYPGSQKAVDMDYPETERDVYFDRESQDIDLGNTRVSDGLVENINTKYDSVTGAPIESEQSLTQMLNRPSIKNLNGRLQDNAFSKETTDTLSIADYIKNAVKQPMSTEQATQQDESGYNYQPPNTKFEQTSFPTRFSTPTPSSEQRRIEFNRGITRRPIITPNVYSQNDETRTSTTRRPFTTKGATSPIDNSYTDYDDGDDYGTDQNTDDEAVIFSQNPNGKSGPTYRPYQGSSTTIRPQFTPDIQKTQKDVGNPVDKIKKSGTITPGYKFSATTPMPSQTSRFGSTKTPQKITPQQGVPSDTIPDLSTPVGRPVTSKIPSKTSDYKYQTTGPVSEYHGTSVVPGYPASGVSAPQTYSTPSQAYSSTMAVPPSSGYNPDYGSQIPSSTPGLSQTSGNYHTGYHYGPPKSDYSLNALPNAGRPSLGFFSPSGSSGIFPTYQQGPDSFLSTTLVPTTPGRSDPFIQSPQGNIVPESSPTGIYTGNFQNGPSTPNSSTIKPQDTNNYKYEFSSPAYSSTVSPSTVSTTSGSFIPSRGPNQSYSTTYRPGFQTTVDTFISGPVVDGFGRPITVEQGGSHPGFEQGPKGTKDNEGPKLNTEQSTAYPYEDSKVIGEDFSGPKQPQRYDPKTGYHYK